MSGYKKILWGSIIAFFVGTSCCWLSSLAIWLGGAVFIGTISSFIEDTQVLLITLGVILLIITLFLFLKSKKRASKE